MNILLIILIIIILVTYMNSCNEHFDKKNFVNERFINVDVTTLKVYQLDKLSE